MTERGKRKDAPYLHIVDDPPDEVPKKPKKKKNKRKRRRILRQMLSLFLILALDIAGTCILLENSACTRAYLAASYEKETADTSGYAKFAGGIVRYNSDGVTFLNRKNEERWIQATQVGTPEIVVKKNAFAVADIGGNSIYVFDRDGLKGEIETALPIEKIALSDQGIVSVILTNDMSPKILTYDAAGNVLVEQQVTVSTTGYPMALEMSGDGEMLAVTYLYTENGSLEARVGYYNFGDAGQEVSDNRVTADQYEDTILGDVFFLDNGRSVVVGDDRYAVYSADESPVLEKNEVITQEIEKVFCSGNYFGFIVLNEEKTGYELRLYGSSGDLVFSAELSANYSNVKLDSGEIILYDGSQCCIYTVTGILKYEGDLGCEILEMFHGYGVNRYCVMSRGELDVIYLTP